MTDGTTDRAGALTGALTAMVAIGAVGIVAGGLVAAATGPLHLSDGSWAAAYLVLVVGVAQTAYGLLQRPLSRRAPSTALVVWQVVLYNLGNIAVLAGVIGGTEPIVDAGGALLVAALVLFLVAVRGRTAAHPLAVWTYRVLSAILLVSIPIGLILAHLRS